MHVGNLPEEVAAQNNELFGTKVIPKLRDIWSEHEDRWTPKVSQERVAARFADGAERPDGGSRDRERHDGRSPARRSARSR